MGGTWEDLSAACGWLQLPWYLESGGCREGDVCGIIAHLLSVLEYGAYMTGFLHTYHILIYRRNPGILHSSCRVMTDTWWM